MLVLRRRPFESILFDGGLKLTLAALQEHRAWLSFSAPGLEREIVLAALGVSNDGACIGVRAPRSIGEDGPTLEIVTGGSDQVVVLVNRKLGEQLRFPGMSVSLQAVEGDRAVLALELASVGGTIGVSIFSVTGAEAKIGIEAPREVRVFREEVWQELEAANTEAGSGWSESDLASLSVTRRRP